MGAIELAVREDLSANGLADLTTWAIVDANLQVEGTIYCKQAGVCVAGFDLMAEVFKYMDPSIKLKSLVAEGTRINSAPQMVATISGKAAVILSAERTALNLLQRMSGIATLTSQFVERAKPHGIKILDTRKTTPGLRVFERYAVTVGGGTNHRFGLHDQILIKDNHIQIAGGVTAAIAAVKCAYPERAIEVECMDLGQVEECLEHGVEKIMLDNMTPDMVRRAASLIGNARHANKRIVK